ncbi:CDS1 isoform 2 [Pan troglodytes]|uniref:CDS1 isoform 2 n=1 Tax=Pan troglodytes TaxID=9598 RepID=A0A2J8PGG8_PANTR|nr:CDS1 isoform 2 [Pan troglodytes]
MLELRHRGSCPGPREAVSLPHREGEAAGGDHETESTSDKVEKLVDTWNSHSNYDLVVFPDHLYGIFHADASCSGHPSEMLP